MTMYYVQCVHCRKMTAHPITSQPILCSARCYRFYWSIPEYRPTNKGTKANDRHRIHYGPGENDSFETEAHYETG